jgi:aminocarboxymuconate-semialdehyde decarboxylase
LPADLIVSDDDQMADIDYRVVVRSDEGSVLMSEAGRASGFQLAQLCDAERRIADMRRIGVAVQVLSVPPPFGFRYEETDTTVAGAICRRMNSALAEVSDCYPERFLAMATVPLQDPHAAADELRWAVADRGMAGVEIGSHVGKRNLDDPALDTFYAAVEDLDVPLFIHSTRPLGAGRLDRYHLRNAIGNPTEDALAVASLIFGGVLDRFPRLRPYVAHGGGSFPQLIGRWDRAWATRPEARASVAERPSAYASRLAFDSLTHSELALAHLVRVAGDAGVMLGSDYPYDMADPDPVAAVERCDDLSSNERNRILESNARQMFSALGRDQKTVVGRTAGCSWTK